MVATVKKIRANPGLAYRARGHRVHVSARAGRGPHGDCRGSADSFK